MSLIIAKERYRPGMNSGLSNDSFHEGFRKKLVLFSLSLSHTKATWLKDYSCKTFANQAEYNTNNDYATMPPNTVITDYSTTT